MEDRVLVVDDIEKNLQLIGNLLQGKGINIMLANSGKKALIAAKKKLPDLILLDIAMPEMDGYEVCSFLKKEKATKDIPVIFLTAKNETEDITKGFAYGAVDYVTKPFKKDELISRVFTHLELKKSKDIIDGQNKQLEIQNTKILEHSRQVGELNQMLTTQNRQLKEANATKDKLFSIISHDLRSPIGTFMSTIDLLTEDYGIEEDMKNKLLKELGKSSRSTYSLLDNLLNWSRSQSGAIANNPSKVNINKIGNEIIDLFEGQSKLKSIKLSNTIDDHLEAYADENLLKYIIRNLLSNALKFTHVMGHVELSAEDKGEHIIVSVKDDGIGMDSETKEKIFLPHVYETNYGTNNETGSGLGLKIVKEFVEKCGGRIWIESEVDKGSEFCFTLLKRQ